MNSEEAIIALGANLPSRAGSPERTIRAALVELARAGLAVERVSKLYSSPAWPDSADPRFVNAVARVRTNLAPVRLLELLHETETAFGRTRSVRNAPRSLDLDIVDFGSRAEEGPPALPHPRLAVRAFVLVPLAEIAPTWRHPITHKSATDMLADLPAADRDTVTVLGQSSS
jgi:2-amino-4-hydroxy-6-hydroxymethyldihydropteridine diphosphokinase